MIDYGYVQAALLLQMVLWLKLYHLEVNMGGLTQVLFYFGCMGACHLVWSLPTIGYFTPWLLFQYILYVMLSVTLLTERFGFKKALCLGFLVVFLNSFYWEFFYHVYEFQIWFPYSLGFSWWYTRIPQWIRVVPAIFLAQNFKVVKWPVAVGLVFSFLLTYARFVFHVRSIYFHPLHRIICLAVLVYTIHISPEKQILEAEVKV